MIMKSKIFVYNDWSIPEDGIIFSIDFPKKGTLKDKIRKDDTILIFSIPMV